MWKLSFCFIFAAFISKEAQAESKILTRWTEVLEYASNAADQATQFYLGGMSPIEDQAFYISGPTASVEKRSARTGAVIWSAPLKTSSQGTWAFSSELLIGSDVKGRLYGIDRRSGDIVWTQEGKGLYFSRPLIHEGRSYWINSYGTLSAHRLEDGAWLWQHSETSTASLHLWSPLGPQMFAGLVLSGFPSGMLMAFETITGNRFWQESFGLAIEDSLALNEVRSVQAEGDFLIASSYSGNVRGWKASAGSKQPLWEKRMSLHAPARFDSESSSVYLSDRQGQLHAVDLETGYIRWSQPLKSGLGTTASIGKNIVWIGTSGGYVEAFNKADGKALAPAYEVGSHVFHAPFIVENDEAIVLSSKGVLRRLHLFPEPKMEEEVLKTSSLN